MKSSELRAKAIRELIETEKTYLSQLHTLQKYFSEPCAALSLLPPAAHLKVFGELPALAALNTELLNTLTLGIQQDAPDTGLCNQTSDTKPASSESNQVGHDLDVCSGQEGRTQSSPNDCGKPELIDDKMGTCDKVSSSVGDPAFNLDIKSQLNDANNLEQTNILQSNFSTRTKDFNACKYNEIAQKYHPQSTNNDSNLSLFLRINVGAAFLKIAPFLKAYSSYATKYQQSLDVIEEHEKRNPKLHSFLRGTESRPEVGCRLVSLLIAPIQRVPRYTLLLAEILRHTPHPHPHRQHLQMRHAITSKSTTDGRASQRTLQSNLDSDAESTYLPSDSVSLVASAACRVDECVGQGQQLQQLAVLQRALHRQRPRIIAPGRDLLKTGLLHKANRSDSGSAPRLFFLFTDILMYTKPPTKPPLPPSNPLIPSPHCKPHQAATDAADPLYDLTTISRYRPGSLVCCCVLPLRHCSVIPLFADTDSTPVFRVVCSGEDLTLYSRRGANDGAAWIAALRDAIAAATASRRTLRKASSGQRPLRRPALRRGRALRETDTTLHQLKASSPLRRLASPLLGKASHVPDSPSSPCVDSPDSPSCPSPRPMSDISGLSDWSSCSPAPSLCSMTSLDTNATPASSSPRPVSPAPRTLFHCLRPSKWRAASALAAPVTASDGGIEDQHKAESTHSLNSLSSKISVALRRKKQPKNADTGSGLPVRPASEPVVGTKNNNGGYPTGKPLEKLSHPGLLSPNCKRSNEFDDDSNVCPSDRLNQSPMKIRVLEGSPFRPKFKEAGPYQSKWDSGEINIMAASEPVDPKKGKTVDLSTAVKRKVINHGISKENAIPPVPPSSASRRPIPYPGRYPRTINGHSLLRPKYDSDKPRPISPDGSPSRYDLLLTPSGPPSSSSRSRPPKSSSRRRSRSCTPDRGFLKYNMNVYSSASNVGGCFVPLTSPHRLYCRSTSNSPARGGDASPARQSSRERRRHQSPSPGSVGNDRDWDGGAKSTHRPPRHSPATTANRTSKASLRSTICNSGGHSSSTVCHSSSTICHSSSTISHRAGGHSSSTICHRPGNSSTSMLRTVKSPGSGSRLTSPKLETGVGKDCGGSPSDDAIKFEEAWRRERLWGKKRTGPELRGCPDNRKHLPPTSPRTKMKVK